jgi:D-3-phosphoglycerate dehydrogenase / 2-oxoglutarate reductase
MKLVLIAAPIASSFQTALEQAGYTLAYEYKNIELLQTATGIVTSTKMHLDATLLKQIPNLKWIARLGSGKEIIDEAYCIKNNIPVFTSPAGIADAVGEHAIGMLICLFKNISKSYIEVNNAQWIREPNRGIELAGHTIGLIGYGHTGQAFAKRLATFGLQVLAYDTHTITNTTYATPCSLERLYAQVDIVSYHVPLTPTTIDYYHAPLFAKSHYLINTSRGPIASTASILKGFESGHLLGACLDVLDFEQDFPLNNVDQQKLNSLLKNNCVITPHIAGYSKEAIQKMSNELAQKLASNSLI